GLYANPDLPPPARVKALEAALFGGLGNLSRTAAQLAGLASPTVADLDQALRRRFISAEGSWRIEVLPKPGVRRLVFAGAMRRFSPGAAGEPVVALARSEIIHHEAALAMAIAFAAAAIAALLYLRDVWDWIIAVFPTLFAASLSAAVAAATGQIVLHSALAGLMPAMAACLSMSIMLVLWERQSRESATARDISIRAAVLPPLACLGIALPLMMSAHPAMAAVGNASALFLIAAMAVNLIVVPQACGWVEALRGPLVKPASSGRAFSRRGRASP
ncbi:MAG: hypothetical protein ACREIB_10640, partial [Pseudomonadota bacterium]